MKIGSSKSLSRNSTSATEPARGCCRVSVTKPDPAITQRCRYATVTPATRLSSGVNSLGAPELDGVTVKSNTAHIPAVGLKGHNRETGCQKELDDDAAVLTRAAKTKRSLSCHSIGLSWLGFCVEYGFFLSPKSPKRTLCS